MRVLYLRTVFWFNLKAGGSVAHTSGVINALSKRVDLDVIANDELVGVNIPITVVPPFIRKLFRYEFGELLYNLQLWAKVKNIDSYDLIYQRYSGYSFIGALWCFKYNLRFVLEFNSSDYWKIKNWQPEKHGIRRLLSMLMRQVIYLPIVNYIEAYNLKRASIIVVVSEALRQSLVAEGVDPNKIFVNPNGYDSSIFYPGLDGRAVRKLHGVTNEILVAFMGTFGPWHGVIELAKSILKFYEFFPSLKQKVKFMLIGDGMLYNEVRALLSSADVSADIIFTGLIPQLDAPKYLAAADILVSPHVQNPDGTRFFGSPTKLFEYMAVGKAIVASDLDQIGEVLVHKESAYLVKPGSVEELVDAIKVLIDDKSLREKIAFGAHSKVSKYYTWDANVERLLERMTHAFS